MNICENLRKIYPNDLFLAMSSKSVGFGNLNDISNKNNNCIYRLPISNAKAMDDDELKSLLHRTVFESRATKPNVDRAKHIFNQITKIVPKHNKIVLISEDNSDSLFFKFYGSHKGTTEFKDSEFGSPVTVFLY